MKFKIIDFIIKLILLMNIISLFTIIFFLGTNTLFYDIPVIYLTIIILLCLISILLFIGFIVRNNIARKGLTYLLILYIIIPISFLFRLFFFNKKEELISVNNEFNQMHNNILLFNVVYIVLYSLCILWVIKNINSQNTKDKFSK